MSEGVSFSQKAYSTYKKEISNIQNNMKLLQDKSVNAYTCATSEYERLRKIISEDISREYSRLICVEDEIWRLEMELKAALYAAEREDDENDHSLENQMVEYYRQRLRKERLNKYIAESNIEKFEAKKTELEGINSRYSARITKLKINIVDCMDSFDVKYKDGEKVLEEVAEKFALMSEILQELTISIPPTTSSENFEDSTEKGEFKDKKTFSNENPLMRSIEAALQKKFSCNSGWTSSSSMKNIWVKENGIKMTSVKIGDNIYEYSCDKSGFAAAYRLSKKCEDTQMQQITKAAFEIECLRLKLALDLKERDEQCFGGRISDVSSNLVDGYVPFFIAERDDTYDIPTISVEAEDLRLFVNSIGDRAGMELKIDNDESSFEQLKQISPFLISAMYDLIQLKNLTGNKYDAAISAYLDAAIDTLISSEFNTGAFRYEISEHANRKQFQELQLLLSDKGVAFPTDFKAFCSLKYKETKKWEYISMFAKYIDNYPNSDKRYFNLWYELKNQYNIKKGIAIPPVAKDARIEPSGEHDRNHIYDRMNERKITEAELYSYMKNARCMFSQWNGNRILYVSDEGMCVILKTNTGWVYKTAWSRNDYDEDSKKILEVLKDVGL